MIDDEIARSDSQFWKVLECQEGDPELVIGPDIPPKAVRSRLKEILLDRAPIGVAFFALYSRPSSDIE